MATGKDILDMLGLDYQSNKDIKPKGVRDPFGGNFQTEENIIEDAKTMAELEKANKEATSPNMKSKAELAEDSLEEKVERTTTGQVAKELSPQEEMLDAIKKYKEGLNAPKKEYGAMDALPDILSGLYNIGVRANPTGLREMKMPNTIATKRAQDTASRQENLTGLQKLQSMYSQYLQTQGKDQLTPYQQAQLEESKKDRELKEKLAKLKASKTKTEPTFEQKEEKKAEIKFNNELKKENREIRKEAEKSLSDIDQQIENVKRANELLAKAEGTYLADTGPIDQFLSPMGKEGQELRQALNDLSLDKMTKMFKNMSKAIDSDAERKFFQQSQVSMGNYPSVNRKILQDMLKNLQSLKAKNKEVVSSYDKKGNEIQSNEVRRKTKDGKIAIFDAETKEFLRYE